MNFFKILVASILILLSERRNQIESTVINYRVLTATPGGFNIDIYLDTANAASSTPHPVLIFFPGFANLVPSSIYSQLLTKFVQQIGDGVILIALDQQENTDPKEIAKNIKKFFDYISNSTNACTLFESWYPNVTLDIENRFTVFACESGTQSLIIYLNQQCGPVKLLILLDPTDGLYQLYDGQATNTTLINGHLPFYTPVLIIQNGLEITSHSVAETVTGPCSPNYIGSDRYFQVLAGAPNSPLFYINFTTYGLGDVFNRPLIVDIKSLVCDTCAAHPTFNCDYSQHQSDVANLTAQFISGIYEQNQMDLDLIENPNIYISNVVNEYQLNGYDLTTQGAFCRHD